MGIYNFLKKYGFSIATIILLGFGSATQAQLNLSSTSVSLATNPDFSYIISWKALTYVPADYKGKILASDGSEIEISFDAVNNQGKIVDLSKQTIEWRLNNNILKSGVGLKSIKFTADKNADQVITITVPNYSDSKYKIAELNTSTTISLMPPELIIKSPYPNKTVAVGEKMFEALPYFFNISNIGQLNFVWEINGAKTANQTNPSIMSVLITTQGQAAENANIGIKALVQNITNQFEFAQNYINLNIK